MESVNQNVTIITSSAEVEEAHAHAPVRPTPSWPPADRPRCIMGKTRSNSVKRSKFFKLFSCLNSKTGSADEGQFPPDERSSPLSSPIKEISSSSPGKPTWLPPTLPSKTHQQTQSHQHGDSTVSAAAAASLQETDECGASKELPVRHAYSSTGSLHVTWPVTSQSHDSSTSSSSCRVNVASASAFVYS